MSTPVIEPFEPDPTPAPLSPNVPLNPPMIGEATPFDRVDAQNRDIILEAIRAWARGPLREWTTKWQYALVKFILDVTAWLNRVIKGMWEYIDAHTIKSLKAFATTLNPGQPATATITGTINDPEFRFGIPKGDPGRSWWLTNTRFGPNPGSQVTVLGANSSKPAAVGDYVMFIAPDAEEDDPDNGRFGIVTSIVTAPSVVRLTPTGSLRGPAGFAEPGTVEVVTGVLEAPEFDGETDENNPGSFYSGPLLTPEMAGVYDLTVSGPAWVRVYVSEEYALADINRLEPEPIDIKKNFGIYLDYLASAEDVSSYYKVLSPGVQYTKVDDKPLWVVIRNLADAPASITLTQNFLTFRA